MKILSFLCLALMFAVGANAQVSGTVSVNSDGVNSYYHAVGQNYHASRQQVVIIHERRIPDEELPVVFFIANRAHVRSELVADYRMAGNSWMDVALHYHLRPSVFYVALNGDPGPDYGNAYSQWRQPRNRWNKIRFSDDDIVKMVNLQFVSTHYRVRPDEVVRVRGEQSNYLQVNQVIASPDYRANRAKAQRDANRRTQGNGRGNGNGNGTDRKGGN